MTTDIFPTHATFRPHDTVAVTVIADRPAAVTLEVRHLGELRSSTTHQLGAGRIDVDLGSYPPGGYHVRATGAGDATTAFDVLEDPRSRPRYGFLSDFFPGRDDVDETVDDLRRLHLNIVQFYDWMYRHHDLLPEDDLFEDLLGRKLSMSTVQRFVDRLHAIGARPIAYGAVYGAGFDYADARPDQGLHRHDGSRWSLGDLLAIMDLDATRGWAGHIIGEFRRAVDTIGFAGIHLDQYGDPKLCLNADGEPVDLAVQFPDFIGRVREALPEAVLIFNNVNDYPTWATAAAPQDATYIEVWSPHDGYGDLARLVTDARRLAPGRPAILAAYLEPFSGDDPDGAAWAARLALATVLAHGGHYLLCGERRGVLVHPYYPNYATVDDATMAILRQFLDAAVALGDILYDPEMQIVTASMFAGVNGDIRIDAPVPISAFPRAGSLWIVVTESPQWTVVHLIDLTAQTDLDWNVAKQPGAAISRVTVEVNRPSEITRPAVVSVLGDALQIHALATERRDGDHVAVDIPDFTGWATVAVPR